MPFSTRIRKALSIATSNPSNVLVSLLDGVPVPVVIDFGVAKAIEQRLTEKTLFTGYVSSVCQQIGSGDEQEEQHGRHERLCYRTNKAMRPTLEVEVKRTEHVRVPLDKERSWAAAVRHERFVKH